MQLLALIVDPPNTATPKSGGRRKLVRRHGTLEHAERNKPASVCERKAGSDFLAWINLKTPYGSQDRFKTYVAPGRIDYAERVKSSACAKSQNTHANGEKL
jgi:hypothetical protein